MSRNGDSPEFRSYYGRPILKEPVWKPEIPWYLFTGGIAGASSSLALASRLAGNRTLARSASLTGLAAVSVSPLLLVKDLGKPARFLNMLRVFKVTSPMSVGSWILAATGTASGTAAACELLGVMPRLRLAAHASAGLLGLPLSTYTGALLADTAVPAWHAAHRELPFAFAGGAAASAGAAAAFVTPPRQAGPARRLAIAGAALELLATKRMEERLGPLLAEPYSHGDASGLAKAAKTLTVAGAGVLALAGRRRAGAVVGGSLLLAGAACARFAVFRAGFQSARDPKYVVVPQRERLAARPGATSSAASPIAK